MLPTATRHVKLRSGVLMLIVMELCTSLWVALQLAVLLSMVEQPNQHVVLAAVQPARCRVPCLIVALWGSLVWGGVVVFFHQEIHTLIMLRMGQRAIQILLM